MIKATYRYFSFADGVWAFEVVLNPYRKVHYSPGRLCVTYAELNAIGEIATTSRALSGTDDELDAMMLRLVGTAVWGVLQAARREPRRKTCRGRPMVKGTDTLSGPRDPNYQVIMQAWTKYLQEPYGAVALQVGG